MTPVRIIGIGSPHGADRVGWLAIDALQKSSLRQLPEGLLSFACCSVPAELYQLVDGCRLAVLLDAVLGKKGEVVAIDGDDLLQQTTLTSVHGVGVADVLDLIQLLIEHPPLVKIIGIGVGHPDTTDGVGESMRRLLPELQGRVTRAVRDFLPVGRPAAASLKGWDCRRSGSGT